MIQYMTLRLQLPIRGVAFVQKSVFLWCNSFNYFRFVASNFAICPADGAMCSAGAAIMSAVCRFSVVSFLLEGTKNNFQEKFFDCRVEIPPYKS
jgi:hypothetical protein